MVKTELRFTYIAKGRYWRFRHPVTGDCPLPGHPGDHAFHVKYAEFMARVENRPAPVDRQSFLWLVKQYRNSAEFAALRAATQLDYSKTLDLIERELGDQPYRLTTRKMVKAVRDDYAATPRKAHKIKQMVSRLYSWADENDLVSEGFNPVASLKRLKTRTNPITPWSEEEIALFLPNASPHVLTAVMLALYTGQRREDVVTMEWRAYQKGFIRVRQSKTGEPIDIACHPALGAHLDKIRKQNAFGLIVRNAEAKPMTANALSQALRRDIGEVPGLPQDRSMHGLKYAAAGRMEEAGCTVAECQAVLGHRTYQMAVKYMTQRRKSQDALAKMEGTQS